MSVRRRLLLRAALAAPLLPALAARAQKEGKPRRIGILLSQPATAPNHSQHFYGGLRELGWVEGDNLIIETRYAEGREERLPELARELLGLGIEILVAGGPSPTRAAHEATRTVPIVMGTLDPVDQGLIASLARPGGNVTGWCFLSVETAEKQLAVLKEAMPQLTRVAIVANPRMAGHSLRMGQMVKGASTVGLQFVAVDLPDEPSLDAAFERMRAERVQAFVVSPDPTLDRLRSEIVLRAARARLPAMYAWRLYVAAGGLMSYGPSLPTMVRLWAWYVDRILRGAKPADLPVQTPRKYELVLNQAAARGIGFVFPSATLLAADEVIS